MPTDHGLGYLPDVRRAEDYTERHAAVAPLLEATPLNKRVLSPPRAALAVGLPAQVDLRPWFSPVETQGALNACSAHVAVSLLEYFEKRALGRHIDASRLFIYKAGRTLLGWTGDRGLFLRTAMQALVLFGAPPEQYWPYDGRSAASNPRYDLEPTPFVYALGSGYRAVKYFRLDSPGYTQQTLDAVRSYAAAGFPSILGLPIYSEFDAPLPGGLIGYPGLGSRYRGAHAGVVAGYDDTLMIGADKGALLVRNSWGPAWGVGGYGWLSYKYVLNGITLDHWTMVSAAWVDTGAFE
jgi:C1A family cysteine protease